MLPATQNEDQVVEAGDGRSSCQASAQGQAISKEGILQPDEEEKKTSL